MTSRINGMPLWVDRLSRIAARTAIRNTHFATLTKMLVWAKPYFLLLRRFFSSEKMIAAVPRIRQTRQTALTPNTSTSRSTKPEAKNLKPSENGESVWPCRTTCVRPRNTSSPESVAMNGGTFKKAMKLPCIAPIRTPVTSVIATACQVGMPELSVSAPIMAPAKATTEPTERSTLPPVVKQKNMPIARIIS